MSRDVLVIDGRAYSWKRLRALRAEQLAARRDAEGAQPTLFALHEDRRVSSQSSAAGRYAEPTLLDWLSNARRAP